MKQMAIFFLIFGIIILIILLPEFFKEKPNWITFLFAMLLIITPVLALKSEHRRSSTFRKIARERGFSFIAKSGLDFFKSLPKCRLFNLGYAQVAYNIIRGEYKGKCFILFEFQYSIRGENIRTAIVFDNIDESIVHNVIQSDVLKDNLQKKGIALESSGNSLIFYTGRIKHWDLDFFIKQTSGTL